MEAKKGGSGTLELSAPNPFGLDGRNLLGEPFFNTISNPIELEELGAHIVHKLLLTFNVVGVHVEVRALRPAFDVVPI